MRFDNLILQDEKNLTKTVDRPAGISIMANSGLVAYGVDSDEEVDKNSGGSASVKQPSCVGSRKDKSSSKDKEGAPVIKSEKGSEAKRSSGSSDRDRDRRQDSDRSRVREDRHHRDTDKREGRHDDKRDRERRREDRFGGRDRRDDRRRRSREKEHRRSRDRSRSPKRPSPNPTLNKDSKNSKETPAPSLAPPAVTAVTVSVPATISHPQPPPKPTFFTGTAKSQKAQEEIQKRRALWNKDKPSSSAVWSATAFTQDQDGKVSAKFKRLMGIKNAEDNGPQEKPAEDLVKKQQELFANLDAQYAVARATTHTQRGVGLGFGSQSFSH